MHDRPRPASVEHLLELVNSDPSAAQAKARQQLETTTDDGIAAVLWRVIGAALRADHQPAEAVEPLGKAIAAAERAGDRRLRGLAQLSLALVEAYLGDMTRACRTIDQAMDVLQGLERAEARFQRAVILEMAGRYDEALNDYRAALPSFRRAGKQVWIGDLLTNRGVLHAQRGDNRRARQDLEAARLTFEGLGDDLGVASIDHNLAWLTTLEGDTVAALVAYGKAEEGLVASGFPVETGAVDHCQALNAAGLFRESADRAQQAAAELAGRGMEYDRARTLVVLAEACAHDGDDGRGLVAADAAIGLLADEAHTEWGLRAALARLRMTAGTGDSDPDGWSLIDALEGRGFAGWVREARILLSQHLIDKGRPDEAADLLDSLDPRSLNPELAVTWWLTQAHLRLALGRPTAAVRAAEAGLRAVRRRQEVANTSEVRAHIGRLTGGLAQVGIDRAVAGGKPLAVLEWLEHQLVTPLPTRASPDSEIRSVSFELRAIAHQLLDDGSDLGPDPRADLLKRQRRAARRLRVLQEQRPAEVMRTSSDDDGRRLDEPRYRLVAYVVSDGQLLAVHNAGGALTMDRLGPVNAVTAGVRQLDLQIRSTIRAGASETRVRRLRQRADELDELLGRPGRLIGAAEHGTEAELVVVTPPVLGAVPFGALPSLAGRPLLTATSLRPVEPPGTWSTAGSTAGSAAAPASVVSVAGPRLGHAVREAEAVAGYYPAGTTIVGDDAVSANTLAEIEGVDVAHLATHGRRSPDNSYFDALELVDGPLFTYELEWLRRPPSVVVMASCNSAVDQAVGDAQRLGVVPALDRVGVWRTIASPHPLPDDDATVGAMTEIHRRMAAGSHPTLALARSAAAFVDEPRTWAVAASLVCRGRPN